ncbi:hypothetical protein RB195_012048 [Necator americanus]|uniref:Uncharacterized protein n=1 Tax=Necator americanus TaxID=51031 RepID=A0ABR1D5A1_NECAM
MRNLILVAFCTSIAAANNSMNCKSQGETISFVKGLRPHVIESVEKFIGRTLAKDTIIGMTDVTTRDDKYYVYITINEEENPPQFIVFEDRNGELANGRRYDFHTEMFPITQYCPKMAKK